MALYISAWPRALCSISHFTSSLDPHPHHSIYVNQVFQETLNYSPPLPKVEVIESLANMIRIVGLEVGPLGDILRHCLECFGWEEGWNIK